MFLIYTHTSIYPIGPISLENLIHMSFSCSWSLSHHPHNRLKMSGILMYTYPSSFLAGVCIHYPSLGRLTLRHLLHGIPDFPSRIKLQLTTVVTVLVTWPLFTAFPPLHQSPTPLPVFPSSSEGTASTSITGSSLLPQEPKLRHSSTELLSSPMSNFVNSAWPGMSLTHL